MALYFTPEEREEALEKADDDGQYGFCRHCDCEVLIVVEEQGYDTDRGFHSLPTDVCGECGRDI